MSDAYAGAGVDIASSDAGVRALVGVLRKIDPGRPSRSLVSSGHYASVLRVADDLAIALATDGVGSKLVVAEQTGRLDTVGIDCIAMNVNDLVCVGAGDVEKQLAKAVSFEDALTRARALRDPVGAALDTLDKEFGRLKAIFGEASASAAEYADLEKLYADSRAKAVRDGLERATGSLKGLLDELTIGNASLSLTDRRTAALGAYEPLRARLAAGDITVSDDFADAARTALDIQRQIHGSQSEFFALQDQVLNGRRCGRLFRSYDSAPMRHGVRSRR